MAQNLAWLGLTLLAMHLHDSVEVRYKSLIVDHQYSCVTAVKAEYGIAHPATSSKNIRASANICRLLLAIGFHHESNGLEIALTTSRKICNLQEILHTILLSSWTAGTSRTPMPLTRAPSSQTPSCIQGQENMLEPCSSRSCGKTKGKRPLSMKHHVFFGSMVLRQFSCLPKQAASLGRRCYTH